MSEGGVRKQQSCPLSSKKTEASKEEKFNSPQ